MTDIEEFIMTIVEDRAPIKGVDLALEVVKHNHDTAEREVEEAIKSLVSRNDIVEIEYTLPSIDYRVKSVFFPKGTKISRAL